MLYSRWQQKTIEAAMLTRRVLLLSGPRQSGKTTYSDYITAIHEGLDRNYKPIISLFEEMLAETLPSP